MAETTGTERATSRPPKISIIGAGNVGASVAYALVIEGVTAEIVLVDIDKDRARGEAMDLNHAVPFSVPTDIAAGDYADCRNSDVVVITAGAAQKAGESRLVLVEKNVEIFKKIVPELMKACPDAILLVVSNPVDVLTYATLRISDLPQERVFGSGTVLDTARFRHELGAHFGVDARNVHAYILGEHGDSEVPIWSRAMIAGVPITEFCERVHHDCTHDEREAIFQRVKTAAYKIIEMKGATYYAIGLGTVRLIEAILRDQHTVLTGSTLLSGQYDLKELCFSLPIQLGRSGIERVIDLPVDDREEAGLRKSGGVLKDALKQVGF